jgi:hypothetical protein
MPNADEKPSTTSLPSCEQAEDSQGIRKGDPERKEITEEGTQAEEAEVAFFAWARRKQTKK